MIEMRTGNLVEPASSIHRLILLGRHLKVVRSAANLPQEVSRARSVHSLAQPNQRFGHRRKRGGAVFCHSSAARMQLRQLIATGFTMSHNPC